MKRFIFVLLIILLSTNFIACDETKERISIVTRVDGSNLYLLNTGGARNDDGWNKIEIYKDIHSDFIETAIEMEFKEGDMIKFTGDGWGGWHDITAIEIISRDNPIE